MASYKNLLDILKRNGCQGIVLSVNEVETFAKYVLKQKYENELKFQILNKNQIYISKIKK